MDDELLDWDDPIDDLLDDGENDDDLLDFEDDGDLLDFDEELPTMTLPKEPQYDLFVQEHTEKDIKFWRKEVKKLKKLGHNYTIDNETSHITGETIEKHFEYFIGHYLRKKCKTTLFLAYHVLCKMRVGKPTLQVKCNANNQEDETWVSNCQDGVVELVFRVIDKNGEPIHPNAQSNMANLPNHRRESFLLETGEPINPESLFYMIDDDDDLL